MWKVYAPVENINGIYASVMFKNSVGETNNPALVEWFKSHGYRVEQCGDLAQMLYEKCDEIEPVSTEPDFEAMTPNELREWAKANGLGEVIKSTRNKEKLLELIRG